MARGGALKQKGRSTWRARWDLSPDPKTGLRRQRSKGGFRTRKDAENYAAEKTVKSVQGFNVDPGKVTLGEFLKLWLDGAKPELRPSTWAWHRSKVDNYIVPALGKIKLRDLTRDDVRVFYGELPPNLVDRCHRTLRKALYEATASNLLPANPVARMKRNQPKTSRGRGMQVWEWDELRRFLEVSDQTEWAAYWRLLAGTGCRRGEGLAIFWTDVDLVAHTVTFQRGLADPGPYLDETKTNASRRTVDIAPDIVAALGTWKDRQAEQKKAAGPLWKPTVTLRSGEELPNELVFTNLTGSWVAPALVSKRFHKLRESAELRRIRPHDLRHTHATLLLKAGVNPKVVQERLGHESIAITLDLYGHVLPSMGKAVATLVGRMLDPKWLTLNRE